MKIPSIESVPDKKLSIDHQLAEINKRILKNEFIPCLTQLAKLSLEDIKNPKIWMLIGFAYTRMGIWAHAISALETAIKLKPGFTNAEHLLSLALFSMGKRQEACELADKVVLKESTSANWMLRAYIHAHSFADSSLSLKVAKDWASRFADPLTRKAKNITPKNKNLHKRLNIGYVTADFREHSVAFFMKPILENHNHDDVKVHVYSNGPEDKTTKILKEMVDVWVDVMPLTDAQMYEKIRSDEIDILIDLSGFTHGHRLRVFAMRAAPIQVTYIGYLPTLGMKAMDYRLSSLDMIPLNQQKFYSEKIHYLKVSSCYSPPSYAPLCLEAPMVRNNFPTLVSLNSSAKITDEMLEVWSRILNLRKDAKLIIMVKESDADAAQADMQPRVEAVGMPLDRVSVMHQQPLARFMEMGHIADIMLDTSPISAGTTALHALWMGLQVVTIDGERGVDASGARTLQVVGAGGVVVKNKKEYVQAVLDLMDDQALMTLNRENIREKMLESGYMKYAEHTKNIENAFRVMWQNFLSK